MVFRVKLKLKNMRTFVSVIVVIILMLFGFWYYMNKKCSEMEKANKVAVAEAVKTAVDSLHAHYALDTPLKTFHLKPEKESTEAKKKSKPAKVVEKEKSNVFTDKRDGHKYLTVELAGDVWMAENLDYKTKNSKCYDDNPQNCEKFGALYPWNDAINACPEGWHLPDDAEWSRLINQFGGIQEAGARLRKGGNSGFNVLWAGYHDKKGFYGKKDISAYFWSATEQNKDYASFKGVYSTVDNIGTYTYTKADGLSVRCVKDKK